MIDRLLLMSTIKPMVFQKFLSIGTNNSGFHRSNRSMETLPFDCQEKIIQSLGPK